MIYVKIVLYVLSKQHFSNIWNSIHEKVKQHRLSWKKALLIKKASNLP